MRSASPRCKANFSAPEVATEMARMHLSTYEELPLAVKLDDCSWWNWNTNCIYEHLTTQWEGGGIRLVARALEIPLEEMDDEYKWIDAKGIIRNNTEILCSDRTLYRSDTAFIFVHFVTYQ